MDDSRLIGLDLANTSRETLELFVEESADATIFKEILDANRNRTDVVRLLVEHANTPEDIRDEAAKVLSVPVPSETDVAVVKRREAERRALEIQEKRREERLSNRIKKLSVTEKIKFAMKGNSEVRGILSKDSNKLVVLAVLDNPRITDPEIEGLARNRSIIEDVLREIARHRDWMKNYQVQLALATNPKTPVGISMKIVPGLKKRDIKGLETNKNVPEAVRTTAKKFSSKYKH